MESPLQPPVPSQRILVIAEDPGLREKLAAAVQAGGGIPVRASGLAELEGPQIPHRLVVYAFDGRPEALQQIAPRLRESAQLVAVTPKPAHNDARRILAEQMALLSDLHCNHVLTSDDRGMWLLQVTASKFVSGDLFGIEKYLPPGADVHLTRLRDFQGRRNAIDEVVDFAARRGVRGTVCRAVAEVCDELLMNALYDAPVDDTGMPLFHDVDVKDRLDKLSPRPVSIRYAVTEDQFAISVRDRFGRLEKPTILRFITKCLQSGDQIDRKVYGAGLGIYLIANRATHYIVNIAPGVATEVLCTFDRGIRQPLRALSIFLYPGPPPGQPAGKG